MTEHPVLPKQRFFLALLGAPLLWLTHFLLRYLYSEARCGVTHALGRTDQLLLLGLAMVFFAGTLSFALFTLKTSYQSTNKENTILLTIGFLVSILFSFVLLMESAGIFFIETCF